jgi:hypothetical protein
MPTSVAVDDDEDDDAITAAACADNRLTNDGRVGEASVKVAINTKSSSIARIFDLIGIGTSENDHAPLSACVRYRRACVIGVHDHGSSPTILIHPIPFA